MLVLAEDLVRARRSAVGPAPSSLREGGAEDPSPAWTAESDQSYSNYAVNAASAGDVDGGGFGDVIVGASTYDAGHDSEGRAFLYRGSATGLGAAPAWTAEGDQTLACFGARVASAGDVNGDGFGDVIVGATGMDNGQNDEGRALVYHGSATGLSAAPAWSDEPDQGGAGFGLAVASAGDVNGDGYGDVVVGAPGYDSGEFDTGRAYLYFGSASGLAATPVWQITTLQGMANLGASAAAVGDVNGDGYGDFAVGAPGMALDESEEGYAWVILGGPTTPFETWSASSDQAGARFGTSVAGAGDVNGDGYGDLVVGASQYDDGANDDGRAFVYLGSATGLGEVPRWAVSSGQANSRFGATVAGAGDVDGDGRGEVLVGAYAYDGGQTDEGRAFLYRGTSSGLATTPGWTAQSDQVSAAFVHELAAAGGVDGDGFGDLLVGAYSYDNVETGEGRAFLYRGSATGLDPAASWTAESDQASAYFARGLASAGDVDGDGYADVVVGASAFDGAQTNAGRVYLYRGSPSGLGPEADWTADGDAGSAYVGFSVASAGDGDGAGDPGDAIQACGAPEGMVADGSDCDDTTADIGPAVAETCDGLDQDCDGIADDGAGPTWFADGDGDGFGDPGSTLSACELPAGYVADATDCDDASSAAHPGAAEGCDGRDDDCDGVADEGFDLDGDGYACGASWDCNGMDPDVHPGAVEGCDGLDEDCDGSVDEGFDQDGDGVTTCAGDCDDTDSGVRPGAVEVCDDGVDNDCDGGFFQCVIDGDVSVAAADAVLVGEDANDQAGFSVAYAGDLDLDGFGDVVVGAPYDDDGGTDAGAVYVLYGPLSGVIDLSLADAKLRGVAAGDNAGLAVAGAGDVTGDGWADILVGAPLNDAGGADAGAVYVVAGPVVGAASLSTAEAILVGEDAGDKAGGSLAGGGDFDGDGVADVLIGAPYDDDKGTDAGAAYLAKGPLAGTVDLSGAATKLQGPDAGDQAGYSVAFVGDTDADGRDDVLVGSPKDEVGGSASGTVYLVEGGASGVAVLTTVATAKLVGEDANDLAGRIVSAAGDVNGDGLPDLFIGAHQDDDAGSNSGAAYVVTTPVTGQVDLSAAAAKLQGLAASDLAGIGLASAGDLDRDGYGDLLVGASQNDLYASNAGTIFGLYGPVSGTVTLWNATFYWQGEASTDAFGYADRGIGIAAGDVDGDGCSDVIAGARQNDRGGANAGSVYVLQGRCF